MSGSRNVTALGLHASLGNAGTQHPATHRSLLDADGVVRSTVSLDHKRDVRRSFGLISAQAAPDPAALADSEVDLRTLVAGKD